MNSFYQFNTSCSNTFYNSKKFYPNKFSYFKNTSNNVMNQKINQNDLKYFDQRNKNVFSNQNKINTFNVPKIQPNFLKNETKRKYSSSSTESCSSEESRTINQINTVTGRKVINNSSLYVNPQLENTEILRVKVKISKDNLAEFKLKRYDDVFETIKLFCEINGVKEELIKPLIMKSLSALNTIYQAMNTKIYNEEDIKLLKKLKNDEKQDD